MEIAAHNLQEENRDINNLWHWPTQLIGYYDQQHRSSPTVPFEPLFWQWDGQIAGNGYAHADPNSYPLGSFNTNEVISKYGGGYAMGVFIDLKPGTYVFSAISDVNSALSFVEYMKLPNGKYVYSKEQAISRRDAGYFEIEFFVPENNIILIRFVPAATDGSYMTVTDIKIREGVL